MAENKVDMEALVDLGKEFTTEEKAETWSDMSEAIDMMTRKLKK